MRERRPNDRPIAALLAPDILDLLEDDPQSVAAETEEMHAADLADIAEELPHEAVTKLLGALPKERAAEVLEYLDEELRIEIFEEMSAPQAALLVTEMTPDDRADLLEELEDETSDQILAEIPVEARRETERLLAYEPESAGGLMTTEFVSVAEDIPVEEAWVTVRRIARGGRREAMHAIYATDLDGRLCGVMSLRELMAAPDGARVSEIVRTDVVTVFPTADREEVARLTSEYDLVAIPVVDTTQRLLGVVTVDDIIDVLQEEHTEDVQHFGGMEALDEPYMQSGFLQSVRKRAGWLAALFIGEMLTASAMQHYNDEFKFVEVAVLFIPLIMSSGGNSGSQATSLLIRAFALREVSLTDWWRVALREMPSGLLLGLFLGAIGFARIELWQWLWDHFGPRFGYDYGPGSTALALTVGAALIGVVMFGTLCGSMLPFLLRRLGFDPAHASAPFVATLVDVTGLVIYFNAIAFIYLRLTSGTH
jgi:magnesium transporter